MKEKVLKTLIVLGIIAIVTSLYVQYGKPYLGELALERQDQIRIKDLDTLNKVLSSLVSTSSTQFIGEKNTIYISIPSDIPSCTNLNLPSTPDGWAYHCSATSTLTRTDGSGWLPVSLVSSTSTITNLPIDPINNANTLNYYSYVASSKNKYAITSVLDSNKYLKERAQNDDGVDDIRYEVGSNQKIWADAQGLIGYWPITEGTGDVVLDKSDNSDDGQITGKSDWDSTDKYFNFNGQNFISFPSTTEINKLGKKNTSYSVGFIIKNIKRDDQKTSQSITEKWDGSATYPWAIRIEGNDLVFAIYDGDKWSGIYANANILNSNKWDSVVCIKNSKNESLSMYVNGTKVAELGNIPGGDISNTDGFTLGSRNTKGDYKVLADIKNFFIYNKALDDSELLRLSNILINTNNN